MESQLRSFAEIYSSLVLNSLICHAGNYTLSHASGLCCFICWFRCLHVQDLLSAQQAQGRGKLLQRRPTPLPRRSCSKRGAP
ncbi:hypothetical protein SAY86_021761 [Trapa natans]|uniref:Uncharacterized protein n=1 Tax=Trapa natans TaxID=22666 RepID=A0AAN7RDA2_TRANT|nr:hypothetical protein SAY86_021761 [Trapa natans]